MGAAVASYLATGRTSESILLGFLVALSSTAIVLKILAEKGETDASHGRIMVGILIFQDLCVVLLMLLIPALSGKGINAVDIIAKVGKAILICGGSFRGKMVSAGLCIKWSVQKAGTAIVMLLCWYRLLTAVWFSLARAFLADLIISESEYASGNLRRTAFKDSFRFCFCLSGHAAECRLYH
jgi:CPA2 family monovalent cation:H+ antiporter-2